MISQNENLYQELLGGVIAWELFVPFTPLEKYKGFIQEILSGLVGHAIALNCVLLKDNEPKQIKADNPPHKITQPKAVKSALDVFGGTVKKD